MIAPCGGKKAKVAMCDNHVFVQRRWSTVVKEGNPIPSGRWRDCVSSAETALPLGPVIESIISTNGKGLLRWTLQQYPAPYAYSPADTRTEAARISQIPFDPRHDAVHQVGLGRSPLLPAASSVAAAPSVSWRPRRRVLLGLAPPRAPPFFDPVLDLLFASLD